MPRDAPPVPRWHLPVYSLVLVLAVLGDLPDHGLAPWQLGLWLILVIPLGHAVRERFSKPMWFPVIGMLAVFAGTINVLGVGLFSLALRRRGRIVVLTGVAAAAVVATGLLIPVQPPILAGPSNASLTARLLSTVGNVVVLVVLPLLVGSSLQQRREVVSGLRAQVREVTADREVNARAAVRDEQARIAAEMHDSLGHKLALITVQAGALEVAADLDPAAAARAAQIRVTARAALADLRDVVGALGRQTDSQTRCPQPGIREVAALVEQSQCAGGRIEFTDELTQRAQLDALPGSIGRAVHRVVQEALTNAHRHAPRATVRLILDGSPGRGVIVTAENPLPARGRELAGSGTGLDRLAERVRTLGGALRAGRDGEVFRLRVDLPWEPADVVDPAPPSWSRP